MGFNHLIKSVAIAVAGAFAFSGAAHAAEITGAGASFPYPVYAKWAELYKTATGNSLNYQSIGSGGVSSRSRPRPSISAPPTPRCRRASWLKPA